MTTLTHCDAIDLLKSEIRYLESTVESSYNKSDYNREHCRDSSFEDSLFEEREKINKQIERIQSSIDVLTRLG